MYTSLGTRPVIAFAANKLAQFGNNPDGSHMNAAKQVLRYLRGTLDYGLVYRKPDEPTAYLHGYCDEDYANDPIDRKSITGYAFLLGGGAINWNSHK